MQKEQAIADHWAAGHRDGNDVYALILSALEQAGKAPVGLTIEDLAPVDHFHARGLPATIDLADRLPVNPGCHILDIGCGLGGPARYFAKRFHCKVTGVDVTQAFVEAGNKLTALLGMQALVSIDAGDGQRLPYADGLFDGAYTQHVTMNVADRRRFFDEACRVLKPGAFFALTEHGLGSAAMPLHPAPWSPDGSGAYLMTPPQTCSLLEAAGFQDILVEDTGHKYLPFYRQAIALAAQNALPPLGAHILMGDSALQKLRNAARNIEEGRTHPVQVLCRKAA